MSEETGRRAETGGDSFQEFVGHYNAIDDHFRRVLGATGHEKRPGFRQLLLDYKSQNPWWQDDADLHRFADLRNVLTHSAQGEPLCQVTPAAIEWIGEIHKRLTRPPTLDHCLCGVTTVTPVDTLARILELIRGNDFSQFPVYDGEEFDGLVTENGIARWLAQHGAVPDPASVTVKDLLEAQERYLSASAPGYQNFEFFEVAASGILADRAAYHFSLNPVLEAILLRPHGQTSGKPSGIVTRWDALRFTHSHSLP